MLELGAERKIRQVRMSSEWMDHALTTKLGKSFMLLCRRGQKQSSRCTSKQLINLKS